MSSIGNQRDELATRAPQSEVVGFGLPPEAAVAHLRRAASEIGRNKYNLAFGLADMERRKLYMLSGHGTTVHFARTQLEIEPRRTREYLQVGRALHELDLVREAFVEGDISWSKVTGILPVVQGETQQAWVDFAKAHTYRELRSEVCTCRPGELPGEGSSYGTKAQKIVIEARVDDTTYAMFERARMLLSERPDNLLSDAELIAELLRRTLDGTPGSEGSAAGEAPQPQRCLRPQREGSRRRAQRGRGPGRSSPARLHPRRPRVPKLRRPRRSPCQPWRPQRPPHEGAKCRRHQRSVQSSTLVHRLPRRSAPRVLADPRRPRTGCARVHFARRFADRSPAGSKAAGARRFVAWSARRWIDRTDWPKQSGGRPPFCRALRSQMDNRTDGPKQKRRAPAVSTRGPFAGGQTEPMGPSLVTKTRRNCASRSIWACRNTATCRNGTTRLAARKPRSWRRWRRRPRDDPERATTPLTEHDR